ncbi:hypothetical protein ACFL5Y_01165 [Candidatus Omnitrophota bacterium]
MSYAKSNICIKTTAVIVAGIFLWNQIVWAGDLASDPTINSAATPHKEEIPGTSPEYFQEQQAQQEVLIDQKNGIEDFVNPRNSYYESGRLKTREVLNEDAEGEFFGKHVKYYYTNDFACIDPNAGNTQGRVYGVDVYDDSVSLDGWRYEISYANSADPSDPSSKIISRKVKKDIKTKTFIEEYGYYADIGNRIRSITLASPDSKGNIYYQYKNEDWDGQGHGRINALELASANENSEITFEYTYYDRTGQANRVYSYINDVRTDLYGTYKYDISGMLMNSILSDGTREIYDTYGRLAEKRISGTDFIKGVNLPWINYGYDLGKPHGSDYWIGYAADTAALREKLASREGDYVRLFLFCDLRSGINFAAAGTPISFTDKVFDDMRALLDTAKMFDIKLMPVLFDYSIADGVRSEGEHKVGEHPDLITEPDKKLIFLDLFSAFFEEFAGDPNIYAWDIINEPEYAGAVSITEMQTFVADFTQLIHSKSSGATVTVGSRDRQSLVDNWRDVGLDLYQYHYYDSHESTLPLDYHAYNLGLDKPVIAGELEPTSITDKLDVLKTNGYAGGLFWEDENNFTISEKDYSELKNCFSGARVLYDYHNSGRGENFYLSDGTLFMKEDYDLTGLLVSTSFYYDSGWLKEIRMADNAWEKYSEDGTLIQKGERTGGTEIVYDASGRIEKLTDGTYEEERRYVLSGSDILYTLALYKGRIKTIKEGYYAGTDIIAQPASESAQDVVSVTYDDDITASYTGGSIKALSARRGYMNFFSGDGILYQNSSRGDLYLFEDNFLNRIATTSGNIYNFGRTTDASGVTVFLTDAIIGGTKCEFLGAKLARVHDNGGQIDIIDLNIKNNLAIGSLTIKRGTGQESVTADDPLFDRIENVLGAINVDIPNIRFDYSSELAVRKILTSEYSLIGFQDGLISKTTSAEGIDVTYEYIKERETITGLRLTEDGAVRSFDQHGNLLSINLEEGGGTTMKFEDEKLAKIESAGSLLENITFSAGGNIESARLAKADGSEYFFTGGRLKDFIDSQNVEYGVSGDGEITRLTRTDTGEVFGITYGADPTRGTELTTFTSDQNGIRYIYRDEFLATISDPSGLGIDYEYDDQARTKKIDISYGGIKNSTYTYEHSERETVITDDLGNKRYYDEDTRAIKLETPYGETYSYGYDIDADGNAITIVNYSQKDTDDGQIIQYFKGQMKRIDRPDGSWVDNIKFDKHTQELKEFSLHTADGRHRNVTLEGKFIQLEMEDSTRLVFYENTLVALANSQGTAPLYDLEGLDEIIYKRDAGSDSPDLMQKDIDLAASSWRHQTYQDSRAIRFVERDYTNSQWVVNLDLRTGDQQYSQGEMYLDLRYDIPGLPWQAPIDMRCKEISFMFSLNEDFEHDPNYPCNIQVFAKDKNWNTQYGTKVEMNESSDWIKVSLVPTDEGINFGHTDTGFDPSNIVMIGLRISEPDLASGGKNCLGSMFIKHDILPDLFENVNHEGSPIDDLYTGLGLTRDLDRMHGEAESPEIETYLESFVDALDSGPSDVFQESLLRHVFWHPEMESDYVKGVQSVYRDADSSDLVLNVDISSTGVAPKEGEIFFDVRKDVPGLSWERPINLTSRPVKMLIKVPEGLVGRADTPNGARIFVEDEKANLQYGTWVNLKEANKWYQLELTPTFGEVPMGYTHPGFDPSKIVKIGVNIATQRGSDTDFLGEVRVRFLDGKADPQGVAALDAPLWMDLRNVREHLVDENDNYIRVPFVNYLTDSHFNYVFNHGSGTAPTVEFEALEKPSTRWQAQYDGIGDVRWNPTGGALLADVDLRSGSAGEILLDVRYDCWVPEKNWQNGSSIDMTTQQLVFYVRSVEGFSSNTQQPFFVEAFTQCAPDWKIQYADKVFVTGSGEWTKIVLMPSPTDFKDAFRYSDGNFNPEEIIGLGLRFTSPNSSYNYTGPVEIRYEINSIDLGISDLSATAKLPTDPVWVNLRDLSDYLKTNEISFYGDYTIMGQINRLIGEIPSHSLRSDFAAMTVYDQHENVSSISKPDGTTTYFNDNNQIDYITFQDGSVFIDYEYDTGGNLTNATLTSARDKIISTVDDIVLELGKKTADTLLLVAEQKKLLVEDFMSDVNAQRAQFARARADLESQQYIEIKHGFLWLTWTERIERPGVGEAIADINRQESEFNRQVVEELAKLDIDIGARKEEVLAEKNLILEEYTRQADKLLLAVRHEEAIPLLHYYYRSVLGRDATREEIDAVFRRIDENNGFTALNANTLKEELLSSDERLESETFKNNVTSRVRNFLNQYVNSPVERPRLLLELGLAQDEVIEINGSFLHVLYDWFDNQDIHFGRSAFGALFLYLNQVHQKEAGSQVDFVQLAKETLLMDILLGITGPMTDERIEISMYTMSRVAALHGLNAKPVRLTYDDILASSVIPAKAGIQPLITLINGRHYVTVLSATETEVTYWDRNIGVNGGEVTISRKDFEDNWQGNAIMSGEAIATVIARSEDSNSSVISDSFVIPAKAGIHILSDAEAKKLKGAFFTAIFAAIFYVTSAIASVVTAAVTAITAIAAPLITLVSSFALGLVEGIASLGQGLMFASKAFLGSLGIGGAVAAAGATAGTTATGFSLSALTTGIGTTLVKVGAGYGVSVGLEALGVDPIVTGLVSSVVTGGVHGLMSGGELGAAFRSAVEWGASAGASLLGQHFDLDPMITSILSMSTNVLMCADLGPNPTFGKVLDEVVKPLAWELGAYGVQYAGMELGLDPSISHLAALGIRSSLQAGLSGFGKGGLPLDKMWDTFVKELAQPTNIALAFNLVGDAIGLDPIINNMMITTVMGAIDGFNENPESRILGIFRGMFENFWNASVRALSFGFHDPIEGGWDKNIQKDYVLMNLTRFVEVVMEYGIEAAIENHLSNIFRDEAIRVINQRGGIKDFLTGDAEMVQEGDIWLKKINVTDEDKLYLAPEADNIIGRDYGNIKERGEYGTNPYTGGFGLINGTLEEITENGTRMVYHVTSSTIIDKMEVYGTKGGYIQVIAKDPETGLELNENGVPLGGIVMDFEKGKLYEYEYLGDSIDFEMNFDNPNVNVQSVVDIDWSSLSGQEKEDFLNYYLVMNGMGNQNPYGTPGYMFNFGTDLANADPLVGGIALIPLYKDAVPIATTDDLVKVVDNPVFLLQDLKDFGYIDENGKLREAFYVLNNSSDMLLYPEFEDKRNEIFTYLKDLNRGWHDDNADVLKNLIEWSLKTEEISNEIMNNLEKEYGANFPSAMTGLCYSGSGDPFIRLANNNPKIDVDSIVLVGTPIKRNRQITNEKIKSVVTIFGSEDKLFATSNELLRTGTDFEGLHLFMNNTLPVSEIAIELKGVDHYHYFYDPYNPSGDIELKQKASRFIAEVTHRADDKQRLIDYLLDKNGIDYDPIFDVYVVDLRRMGI